MSELEMLEKKMSLPTPECEKVEMTAEEIELNCAPFRLTFQQFETVSMTTKNRITSAVGQVMQLIEMLGLQENQEKATKDNIKRVLWKTAEEIENSLMSLVEQGDDKLPS